MTDRRVLELIHEALYSCYGEIASEGSNAPDRYVDYDQFMAELKRMTNELPEDPKETP